MSKERKMFEVKAVNYFEKDEDWAWDSLTALQIDYSVSDKIALPNDFDKVKEAYIKGKKK